MEIETVKTRLSQFLKYKKLSQSKFEKAIGTSNGYVNSIRSSIQPDKLERMAMLYPELNISWLLIGEKLGGPMLKEAEQKSAAPDREEHTLPLIPFEAVAGPGVPIYEDERIEDYYTVSDFKESDFLIRVKGDSMVPKYNGGDIVACKKVDKSNLYFLQWGRVYVIYTMSQGAMIKRIQPSKKDGWITCVSENIKYAPFDVPMDDIVSIALVNGSISLE